ncbi:WASH complex subunit 2 isoform 2-T2 [Clarias gariepinus]|uniref:WASH complex subunit 2 isoform X2 n=1 Tax=Clarias gariepinus TaxID=13013 RepID=UPI00234D45DA|nr:WASH complex subunit 2 isoform X2 [Clarias gariepinus]
MAEPMENGPSSCNGEAEQVWERPWTLDEMRKNSVNWSLAADSGLFLYLQDFSQRMVSKTHEIEKQLDGLIRDTKATDSCLHTVFNDFLMLSNIQFIENRVYDEEVEEPVPKTETQEKRPEQEKTREQKEAELIPKIQEAVNYGLKVLESAFEQLDVKVGNSDSEDEEAADRVEPILEPKDLYVDRPLPYLIGSQAFMEQDDIGLGDLSSDEMSIDSDRESLVESEVDKDQDEHSDDDFDQEGESREKLKKKQLSSDEDEENEDSDLFGESDKDEDEARRDDVGPASFADQLAARIKDTTKKPETDRTSLSSGTSATKKKHQGKKLPQTQVEDDDEMFKPPKMEDEEYSPFGEKGGLFSGGKGLFDDDDEGDLFSEAPKKEKEQSVSQKSESVNTKKIPTGAVSIFPENSLFGSPNGSDSLESKENDRLVKSKVQDVRDQPSLGGGLFDDNEDDDFFSGSTLKKPTSATQKKANPKMTADLFGGDEDDDDEDGDIFSAGSKQSKKVVEEEVQTQEKKLPAGAISIFGPGTNSLLAESLKKRHPSTSEESVKSEESMPPAVVKPPVAPKTTEKAMSKSLFSDDEDSQIFPTMPKSQSKPEGPAQNKPSKPKVSIFDDDEEEDLFASVPKSQSVQVKTAVPQPKKALSSSLFSDDEDQWISSQPSPAKSGGKSGGMKASTSAPSRLPSASASQTDSLFNDDDDDLFAATKEPSQKKPQRVSLLFEDEDDEDKGSLFGIKQSVSKGTPEVKVPAAAAASQAPTLFGPEETQEEAKENPLEKATMQTASSPEESNKSKKPAGAVSLFGGINVLGDEAKTTTKQTRNALEDIDDIDWHKEAPPPMETKEKRATKNTFSLFDDEDEDEPNEIPPLSSATKHMEKSTLKEPRTVVKSTGVFQDEELLFSQTQQRDNDPEVDLFATSTKPSKTVSSSVKPAVSALFGEEEEDDDLFSSAKPKAPPKVPNKASKAKHEETDKGSISAQSAKSEASLAINPASLMPGAGPRTPGAVSIMPDLAQSSSPRSAGLPPESAATAESRVAAEGGIGFETPAQVTTLQNANKDRVKGATQRRPQTRAARHLAAQRSEESRLGSLAENSAFQADSGARTTSVPSAFNPIAARPSALTLPITTSSTTVPAKTVSDGVVRPKVLPLAEADLFSSEDLFASASAPKHTPPSQTKAKPPETVSHGASKKKEPTQSIINDHSEDLFATVKPKTVKKAKAMPLLDDDDDIFATETKKASKTLASSIKPDIFQDVDETPSKVLKKPKEQSLEASLFDDVDIFADLTPVTKLKEKKAKKKVETKSIFDDDMDDIFSSGITKPVGASTAKKSKKPVQELNSAEDSGHNIFDDPLNVFGGK